MGKGEEKGALHDQQSGMEAAPPSSLAVLSC
jgi:hypothetical protein